MIISLNALFDQALFINISKDAKHSFKSNFIFLNMTYFLSEAQRWVCNLMKDNCTQIWASRLWLYARLHALPLPSPSISNTPDPSNALRCYTLFNLFFISTLLLKEFKSSYKTLIEGIDAFGLWCWRRLFKSPLDFRKIQPVHPKGNQFWMFIGMTDAEAETLIFWSPDAKNQLIGKDPDAGKDWRQEEKGMTEDETVGWHHWLYGHEFE